LAQDIDLFLMLMLMVSILFEPAAVSAENLNRAFYILLFIHVGFSLYVGISSTARTITWCLLIIGWVGSELVAFAGYVLPWGQMSFWLAHLLDDFPLIGRFLEPLIMKSRNRAEDPAILWPILGLILLCLDLLAMHYPTWRQRSLAKLIAFLAAAIVMGAVVGLALAQLLRAPSENPMSSYNVLPSWPMLPLYAVLRSVPDTLMGIIAMFAAMLAPVIWPWARVELLRESRLRWLWVLFCLVFTAVWIGLGYIGAMPLEGPWRTTGQALTILYFCFFILPFVLVRANQYPNYESNPAER
jgi:ubiquinol-cytochrome c reductase cytochrome b/c1 subunit